MPVLHAPHQKICLAIVTNTLVFFLGHTLAFCLKSQFQLNQPNVCFLHWCRFWGLFVWILQAPSSSTCPSRFCTFCRSLQNPLTQSLAPLCPTDQRCFDPWKKATFETKTLPTLPQCTTRLNYNRTFNSCTTTLETCSDVSPLYDGGSCLLGKTLPNQNPKVLADSASNLHKCSRLWHLGE